MNKKQALNYITVVFAIGTIGMAIYSIKTKENIIATTIMLFVTIIINYFSNKYNLKDVELNKKDKEFLKNMKNK